MIKLGEKETQVLIQIDERIDALHAKKRDLLKRIATAKIPGDGAFSFVEGVVKLATPDENGKQFVRVLGRRARLEIGGGKSLRARDRPA